MSLQKGDTWTQTHAQREETQVEGGHPQAKERGLGQILSLGPLGGASPANTLISSFWPPDKCQLFKPPGLQYCVRAALAKEYMTLPKTPPISWAPPPGIPACGLDTDICPAQGCSPGLLSCHAPPAPATAIHWSVYPLAVARWKSPFRGARGVVWA